MTGYIAGTGVFVPDYIMDNDEISTMVETSDEWIQERTGIARRKIAKEDTVVSMAYKAAVSCLEKADFAKENVECIIVSTCSAEEAMPIVACQIQALLEAEGAACLDINVACTGFIQAFDMAQSFIESGRYENVLVIGSEKMSRMINWKDRGTCILFGDGAGATLLRRREGKGYLPVFHGDGKKGNAITYTYKPVNEGENDFVEMDGRRVFEFATRKVPSVIQEILEKNQVDIDNIPYFVLHQANARIIDVVAKRLKVDKNRIPKNMMEYGNTSSASIPILLDELIEAGTLKKGQKIVMAGFGAGLSWGGTIVEL